MNRAPRWRYDRGVQTPPAPSCVACKSPHVTAPTMFGPDEGQTRLSWKDRTTGKLFRAIAHRASVCLECGHVALSLDANQLATLRQAIGNLTAM
jgi:hypothetical protein